MPKRTSLPRILAIDPGTKEMGVAFLEGDQDLAYYGVKSFRCERTPRIIRKEIRRAITRLIAMFQPDTLILERLYYVQQKGSKLLNLVYKDLKTLGREEGLRVVEMAPSTARKALVGDGRATKLEVARFLAVRFPELQASLIENKRRRWQQKYWLNMFDAVALALAHRTKAKASTK